jgi:hypothetical protein
MWKQSDLLIRAIHKGWIFNRKKQARLSYLRNINIPGPLKTIHWYAIKDYRTAFFWSLYMAVKAVSSLLICMPWVIPSRSQIQLIFLACCAYFTLSKSSESTEQDWMRYGGFDGPLLFFRDGTDSFTLVTSVGRLLQNFPPKIEHRRPVLGTYFKGYRGNWGGIWFWRRIPHNFVNRTNSGPTRPENVTMLTLPGYFDYVKGRNAIKPHQWELDAQWSGWIWKDRR